MFGMGMTEILVILVVAMLFLGPEKLPEAAKQLSKGIRDLRKQTKEFQDTIENDTQIGGAIRDIKSALRGDELRRPPIRKAPPVAAADAATPLPPGATEAAVVAAAADSAVAIATESPAGAPAAAPDLQPAEPAAAPDDEAATTASEAAPDAPDEPSLAAVDDELAAMIRPVVGAVGRGQAN